MQFIYHSMISQRRHGTCIFLWVRSSWQRSISGHNNQGRTLNLSRDDATQYLAEYSWFSQDNCCYFEHTGWVIFRFFKLDVSKVLLGWRNKGLMEEWDNMTVRAAPPGFALTCFLLPVEHMAPPLNSLSLILNIRHDRKGMLQYTQRSTVWLRMMKLFAIIKTKVACSFFFSIAIWKQFMCDTSTVHCLCMVRWDGKWFRVSRQFRRVKINLVLL